ncbi:hypothetical protein J5N97_012266 [Dioscorea zingiberensis]|uniref:Uncharacterized protein n=1 Tax=Dioscorea zingiberensis TaxID=325984 RepID=A0A9D5CPJ0_9LILI|nr:hypothetical protein J5N97_012266 [Dioscorea zingiberensis]
MHLHSLRRKPGVWSSSEGSKGNLMMSQPSDRNENKPAFISVSTTLISDSKENRPIVNSTDNQFADCLIGRDAIAQESVDPLESSKFLQSWDFRMCLLLSMRFSWRKTTKLGPG